MMPNSMHVKKNVFRKLEITCKEHSMGRVPNPKKMG